MMDTESKMRINDVTTLERVGRIGVVTIDNPPVNALSALVRAGLVAAFERALADPSIAAIVLICSGRTFFAGADISEFGKPPLAPTLRDVQHIVEDSPKRIVAAIHGTALGGGLELALVAHDRVAVSSARLGLPEVKLGLLPGAGGTQRLPRVVGVEIALKMITSGDPISAADAQAAGLVDALVPEGELRESAVSYAERAVAERRPLNRIRDRDERLAEARTQPGLVEAFRAKNAQRFRGFKAPENAIRAVEAVLELPIEEGLTHERALFDELLADSQSAAQRHLFFAERRAARIDDIGPDVAPLPVTRVGVIGAGTMGGGIAMNFLNAGIPVTLVDAGQDALDRGLGVIRKNYEATAAKGRMTAIDVDQRMALLRPSLALEDLCEADLIIEAVFEDIAVKREVFARLDAIAGPNAILATNTSYLDIGTIASATDRPESIVGLHFFSPANVMKLLEIVRTRHTAKPVLATAVRLARTIGKTAVTVGNGFGFVGNRMLAARDREVNKLLLEGATPSDVDHVLRDFGFPMGHLQMRDLVGLDVGWNRATSTSSTVREVLNEMGRHGQKSGGGYYDYDEQRRPTPSPVALEVIKDVARRHEITRRAVDDTEIRERTLYAMVNEGARILDEGIAARAGDIDVIWTTGYGWPRYRGGPMFWAGLEGLPHILERLRALEATHGEDFTPSPLITRLVAEGRTFDD